MPDRSTFERAYAGQAPWDIGRPQQAESMGRLAAYRFEWVLPGHGQRVHLPAAEMRQHVGRLAESMRERSQV